MTATANPETTPKERELKDGRVVAIAGPVVDVEFPPDALPEINFALEMDVELEGETITITSEVAQQIGDNRVRVVCLKQTARSAAAVMSASRPLPSVRRPSTSS